MASTMPNNVTDDILELEKVAVGPYCVFDAFKPRVSPDAHCTTTATSPGRDANSDEMDNPNMAGYQYGTGVWSTAADDITLTASATDGLDNWNEFMQWGDTQSVDIKPSNSQGPLCTPDQRPLIERRQNSNMTGTSLSMQPETIPVSAPFQPQINATPYTFGGDIQNPPAFDFDNSSISPPSSGGGQQQGGMFPSPAWQQQDKATGAFSAAGFTPAHVAPVQLPPASASTPSLRHSPTSLTNARTSSSSASPSVATSPESMPSNPKKRKSTSEDFETPAAKKDNKQPPKKTAHNMIEKRYRTNLNDKIAALRDSVPSLRVMSRQNGGNEEDDDPEDLEGLTPAHKLNKATVLSKATEYIRHLEKRNKRMMEEINTLKGRLDSYERMATTGLLPLGGARPAADGRYHEDPFAGHVPPMLQQPLTGPPQGLIPVPDNMANLHRGHPQQAHYAPQHGYGQYTGATRPGVPAPPMVQGQRGSGMFSKLMVGSLATLMLVEGFSEREQSGDEPNGRGLFALPIHLAGILAPRISIGGASAQIPLAKVLLLFGALFYFLAPLFDPKPKSKKKAVPGVMLARVPSLASPVEVRRSAWLTAIQTVWVPKHNFCLEAAALGLKTLKLSLRTIIGWPGYALLMGTTKDHEAARIKAWDIALDAQLTGGDAEISKSRLILTLMASGTLPDTPARLMLKALHIRVLLWELTNTCNGGWRLLDDLSAKLARSYWNAARSEQRIAANMASKPDSEAEPLPEHLAALLEMECDDVLIPSIIQRAYNLAWNRPSAENTSVDESMDTVVEDFSICSPLDALAAWWSSHVLRRALAASLASKNGSTKAAVKRDLDLASQTAPSTSQAHLRALVARSILEEEGRSQRITTAFKALPSTPSSSPTTETNNPSQPMALNVVGEAPMATDVQKALTLTKCLSLVESGNSEGRRRAVSVLNNFLLPKSSITLLSFVAGYKVLNHFTQDASLRKEATFGLERLASSLRIWIGHEPGRRSGLSDKIRGRIVGQCLDASKTLVGLPSADEIDDGYVSGC